MRLSFHPIKAFARSRWSDSARAQSTPSVLAAGLAATLLSVGLWAVGAWEPIERVAYTGLFLVRDRLHPIQWDDRLAVIAIDEASLAAYGAYPWSRDQYTRLLDRLMAVQPAAIGLGILMPEATPEDAQLADSIRLSSNVVLAIGSDPYGNFLQVSPSLIGPTEGFVRLGHVNHLSDTDGLSRQAFLYEIEGTQVAASFAIAIAEAYQHSLQNLITAEPIDVPKIRPEFLTQPQQFDRTAPLWINWPGATRPPVAASPQTQLTTLSFVDVLTDNDGDLIDQLQNKIVLLGYTSVGTVGETREAIRTPFERRIPTASIYLHAAIVDNLLNDRFLRRLSPGWTLACIALVGFGSSLVLKPLKVRGRLLVMLAALPLWSALVYGSFLTGLWLPVAAPMGASVFALMACQFAEQRERQTLMDLFQINLSPEMAKFIWQHQQELLTDGMIHSQTLKATLLFVDIRGFSAISEKLPSDILLPWLNRYFEVMTDCIMAHGGIVDKYIGDAIMAAFGGLVTQTEETTIRHSAIAAVHTSLAIIERLQDLNEEFAAKDWPQIKLGIGIHTGTLVGGTVGSRHRASYSLFGDTVNIAARLQEVTKTMASDIRYPILLSEATYEYVHTHFLLEKRGHILLRGRTEETTIFTPTDDLSPNWQRSAPTSLTPRPTAPQSIPPLPAKPSS